MEPEEIREQMWLAMKSLAGPAMGTSLVVMFVVRWIGGKRVGSLATLLAVSAAVVVSGFYISNAVSDREPWLLDNTRSLDMNDLRLTIRSLEEKPIPPEDNKPSEEAEQAERILLFRMPMFWLPFLAGLAMLAEFLLPLAISGGPSWAIRTCIALFAGRLLCPSGVRMLYPWISWALGLAILLEWALLTGLARRWLDGVVPTVLGFCMVAATMVLMLVANYGSAYDLALLLGSTLVGPALISWIWPSDTSPALAAMAVALPSLMLLGHAQLSDPEPFESFLLAGLAPLALLPMSLPFLARREGWFRWIFGLALPLVPAVLAVVWAV